MYVDLNNILGIRIPTKNRSHDSTPLFTASSCFHEFGVMERERDLAGVALLVGSPPAKQRLPI